MSKVRQPFHLQADDLSEISSQLLISNDPNVTLMPKNLRNPHRIVIIGARKPILLNLLRTTSVFRKIHVTLCP